MRTLALLLLISTPALAGGYPFTKETRLKNSHKYGPDLYLGDLNGDGVLDVVALSEHKFSWFLNQKKGSGRTFVEKDIDATFKEPYAIDLVDMDGDGDTDVVGLARYKGIAWWENKKKGKKWKKHVVTAKTDGRTRGIGAGDVDGDGDMDLVIAGRGVAWLENEGKGKFGEPQQIYDRTRSASDLLVADFDGDGDADVVGVADLGQGYSSLVYWSNNDGPWEKEQLSEKLPLELRAQDLDGDKDLDVVATQAHEVQLFLADEDGLTLDRSIGVEKKIFYGAAAVGDFDNDGDLDLINGTANGNQGLLLVTDPGDDEEWVHVVLEEHPVQPRSMVALDFDGDKDLDFVATYWSAGLRSHKIKLHENKPRKKKKKKKKKSKKK